MKKHNSDSNARKILKAAKLYRTECRIELLKVLLKSNKPLNYEQIAQRLAKKRLIQIAIDKVKDKPGIEKLKEHLKGMPAIIFTNENPFKLFKSLEKTTNQLSEQGFDTF